MHVQQPKESSVARLGCVLKQRNPVDKVRFSVDNGTIRSIAEKPVTSLGEVFDCRLRDTAQVVLVLVSFRMSDAPEKSAFGLIQ